MAPEIVLRFPLRTPKGRGVVLTAWIVRHGEDFPRLTTCYIVQAMNGGLATHDLVALLEDTYTKHFEHGQPLLVRRGQIGTVVMTYDDGAVDVEFADRDGRTYALLPLPPEKLVVLHDAPDYANA